MILFIWYTRTVRKIRTMVTASTHARSDGIEHRPFWRQGDVWLGWQLQRCKQAVLTWYGNIGPFKLKPCKAILIINRKIMIFLQPLTFFVKTLKSISYIWIGKWKKHLFRYCNFKYSKFWHMCFLLLLKKSRFIHNAVFSLYNLKYQMSIFWYLGELVYSSVQTSLQHFIPCVLLSFSIPLRSSFNVKFFASILSSAGPSSF